MVGSSVAMRVIRRWVLGAAWAASAGCQLPSPPGERVGQAASAVISGSPDSGGNYSAVGHMVYNGVPGGCSALYVGNRVAITAGHCMAGFVTGCTTLATAPVGVQFASATGGFLGPNDAALRTIRVVAFKINPKAVIDIANAPCSPSQAAVVCAAPAAYVDRAREATLLYLASEPPADVAPLPIIVHKDFLDPSSAAKLVSFAGIESWATSNKASCDVCWVWPGLTARVPRRTT